MSVLPKMCTCIFLYLQCSKDLEETPVIMVAYCHLGFKQKRNKQCSSEIVQFLFLDHVFSFMWLVCLLREGGWALLWKRTDKGVYLRLLKGFWRDFHATLFFCCHLATARWLESLPGCAVLLPSPMESPFLLFHFHSLLWLTLCLHLHFP